MVYVPVWCEGVESCVMIGVVNDVWCVRLTDRGEGRVCVLSHSVRMSSPPHISQCLPGP